MGHACDNDDSRQMNMEQLLLHLIGDYITQTNWMATEKARNTLAAIAHALVYALPFLLIGSKVAVILILLSHFLVDRFSLARFVAYAKNKVTEPSLRWDDCKATGYPPETPIWLSNCLLIVVDNTLHISSNYLVLSVLA